MGAADQISIERAVAQILARKGGTLHAVVHNTGIGDAGVFEDDLLPSIRETWGSMISIRSLACAAAEPVARYAARASPASARPKGRA